MAAAVLLLGNGADRHLRDHDGRTAMDWARRFGSTRLLDVLLFDPNKVCDSTIYVTRIYTVLRIWSRLKV